MSRKLRKITLIVGLAFTAVSMCIMMYAAKHKAVVIDDVAQDQVMLEEGADRAKGGSVTAKPLRLNADKKGSVYIDIPIEKGIKADRITIENHYMTQELWIGIEHENEEFYSEQEISGDLTLVEHGSYERDGQRTWLKFKLSGIYECRNILEDKRLFIELVRPKEVFEKIVIIDPGHGGSDTGCTADGAAEKDIVLNIARHVKEKMDLSDIKVYYTRMEDKTVSQEERLYAAQATDADMYVSIHLGSSPDDTMYGVETVYNSRYFIPRFGNVELADLLERNVATQICGRGNGLTAAQEADEEVNAALLHLKIPAAAVQAGYLSNEREAALLQQDAYCEEIAEGISRAIEEAYEELGK